MIDFRLWRVRLTRWGTRVLAALGLLYFVVSFTPVNFWWAAILEGPDYTETGDVLIVLSGSMMGDGSMGWSSYLRTTYAGRAFHEGGFKEVLVTGGSAGQSKVPVAIAMGEFLKFQGVPSEAIHLETRSRSTRENALYSSPLLSMLPGSKVLLTSDYHMFRARRAFARAGIQVFPQPVPDVIKRSGEWWMRWPAFLDLLGETVKIGYYWAHGWI
ncbi:MAG TPA: YdcF family protein [Terriglobia bacterium]|nr:YdcF family protein [Terriglobia bacterium]